MSIPSCLIRCEKCNATFSYAPGHPRYVYATSNGTVIPASVSHGWCEGCNKPVPMQLALSPAQVEADLASAQATLARFPKPGIFGSLFQKRLSADEHWDRAEAQSEQARLFALRTLLGGRTILPRCLECDCHAVEPFGTPEPRYHSACGGRLKFSEGPWISLAPSEPIQLELR